MRDQYVLSDNVKYRREHFGGVVFHRDTKETHFFNHMAAFAIENFRSPSSIDDVKTALGSLLGDRSVKEDFFNSLVGLSIIAKSERGVPNNNNVYFSDITDFSDKSFYSPLAVELELTLKCMRNCVYCAYDSSPAINTSGQLSLDAYQDILKGLERAGVFYIRFTGGDPLTRTDSLEIMNLAENLGFGFAVASDLTVLREEQAKKLGEFNNLISLQTTLDGSNPAIADKLRGNGNYRKTLQGISLLRDYGVPLIVGTILTKHNVGDIYHIAKLLSEFDVSYCVSPLYDAGRARSQRDLIPTNDDLAHAYDQFACAVNDGLVRPADPGWSALAQPLDRKKRDALWNSQPWLVRSPDRIMRVDPYGRCYTSIHLKEVINDDVYVGSLLDNDVVQLWNNSPLLNTLRSNSERNEYFGNVLDIREINSILETKNEE